MILDDLIGFFSPKAQLRRLQYRKANEIIKRKYEGATHSRRTQGWRVSGSSANAEVAGSIFMLRNRSRDLIRNNPYAARAKGLVGTNCIGKGIIPAIKADNEDKQTAFRETWKRWANTKNCDFDGINTFYGLQKLATDAMFESGEVLIRRRYVSGEDFPIKLQVLESDFIVNTLFYKNPDTGNKIIQGIEFDEEGRRVAYHLYQAHPGNSGFDEIPSFKMVRVPAEEILHIYRVDRPGQVRGVPWLSSVIIKLRDFDEFEDAQLVRQKIAACFSVFVHDIEGIDESLVESNADDLPDKVEPGLIEILPPGKDITFASPPSVDNYKEYTSVVLHSIAAGIGLSYEALTGDLSEVNFSSARMGWIEFNRNIESWRSHIINPSLNDPVFDWFLQASILVGLNPENVNVAWTAPKREMIDPTKEVPAKIKAIRAGIDSLSDAIRQQGKHPEDHLAEIKADNDLLDKLELKLDSDPRQIDQQGQSQGEE